MSYVNLYTQTEYSLLESNIRVSELPRLAKEKGYSAIGIGDNNLSGAIKFYKSCLEANIKPIIGVKISLGNDVLLLYAKNNDGYKNLLKIRTKIETEEKDLYLNDIKDYLNNLVLIIPGDESEIVKAYIDSDFVRMQKELRKYFALKANDNLSLYLGLDVQTKNNKYMLGDLIYLAKQNGLTPVAIRKTNYCNEDDYDVYRLLRSISLNYKGELYQGTEKESNSYLLEASAFDDLYRKYPELVEETENIANMCNVTIDFVNPEIGNYHMPKFVKEKDKDASTYLKELSYASLKRRIDKGKIDKKKFNIYLDRLEHELDVIDKMGFSEYFLIVRDFVIYAKKEGILVGHGRGSALGSLVAYVLRITEIDPIEHGLIFERFLNEGRKQMPDIDVDFPDEERIKVLEYMKNKYSKERVAHICAFDTYKPRSAIDDIIRVYNLKDYYKDTITSFIDRYKKDNLQDSDDEEDTPRDINSLRDLMKKYPDFVSMVEGNDTLKTIVNLTLKMENLPRNLSVHASGIIMADSALSDYTPLTTSGDGLLKSEYEAIDLEELGLVKFDFLGIRNLTIITKALNLIGVKGKNIIKIYDLPLDDHKVCKMLESGKTASIFQISSRSMTEYLKELKTNNFNDISSVIALNRPGPKKNIPLFSACKNGKQKVTYLDPALEPILKETYGIIVYQEQILEIAKTIAGFTLSEADSLRRAVSKKKEELLKAQKEKFISGAIKNGHSEEIAKEIYDLIYEFANYGFNKSHTIGYSVVAYLMAYLKYHFPKEFYAAALSFADSKAKKNRLYNELSDFNINVEIPNINYSDYDYTVVDGKLYYALDDIKEISIQCAKNIVKERENGLYKSYDDFVIRTKDFLKKKNVDYLVYSGALDVFGLTRKTMINEYEVSLKLANYGGMFSDDLKKREYSDEEYKFEEIAELEKDAIGRYLKFNIFNQFGYLKNKYKCVPINKLEVGKYYNVLFVIEAVSVFKTKKGNLDMASLVVSDDTNFMDCTVFNDNYVKYKDYLNEGELLIANGKIEENYGKKKFILREIHVNDFSNVDKK